MAKIVVNRILRYAGLELQSARAPLTVEEKLLQNEWGDNENDQEANTRRVLNLVRYTKASSSPYHAGEYDAAYHTMEVGGKTIAGQRDPKQRLSLVPFDFSDKTVLDVGCNQGGMLFNLSVEIKHGVGIDFDSRMINAANRIKSHKKCANLDFYVFDLESESLRLIPAFLHHKTVDIVFLLSVCMWVKNWKEVISYLASIAPAMLFETNGSLSQQDEQTQYLRSTFSDVQLLSASSPDDPKQKFRTLLLCRH
jgi:SAM-dependent methyltransferase